MITTKLTRNLYRSMDMVREFHARNNAIINDEPITHLISPEVAILRSSLVTEEFSELMAAARAGSLLLMADAAADLKYVVLGTAVTLGVSMADEFPAPRGPLVLEVDKMLAMKALGVIAPVIGSITTGLYNISDACRCDNPVCPASKFKPSYLEHLHRSLVEADLMVSEYVGALLSIPLLEVFEEVHRANLSKTLGGTAPGEKYAPGGGKGASYVPPNIGGILQRAMTIIPTEV